MIPRKHVLLVPKIVVLALSVGMGSVTRKWVKLVAIVRRTAELVLIFAETEYVVPMKPVHPVLRIVVIVRVAGMVFVTHRLEKHATTVPKIAAVVRIYVGTEYVDPKRAALFVPKIVAFVRIFAETVSAGLAKIVILVLLTVAFVLSAGMVFAIPNKGRIVLTVRLIAANAMIFAETGFAALPSLA